MSRPLVTVTDHEISDRAPLRVAPGDRVEVGDRDTTWPAFVFVRTAAGEGWVPERHLDGERPTVSVVDAYDTTELAVRAGDRLSALVDDPESGWVWCEDATGRQGWVPQSVVADPHGEPMSVTAADDSRLPAEARARALIDGQLEAAGWLVQDREDLDIVAHRGVAVREAPTR